MQLCTGEKYAKTEPEALSLDCIGEGDPKPDKFVWTLPDGTTQETATLSIGKSIYQKFIKIF